MAPELTVILGDFFIPARAPQADPLPRFPGLERLLARAERLRLQSRASLDGALGAQADRLRQLADMIVLRRS